MSFSRVRQTEIGCFQSVAAVVLTFGWAGCLGLICGVEDVSAIPVCGQTIELRQPNGERVPVRVWGDEFHQVVESLEGYTLVRNPSTNQIEYARLSADGNELLATGVPPGAALHTNRPHAKHIRINEESTKRKIRAARSQHEKRVTARHESLRETLGHKTESVAGSFNVTSGNVRGICLLIDFPDEPGIFSPAEVERFCNQVGYGGYGNNGSIRDYYRDVSDGRLDLTNYVPDAYYTAKHEKAYYDHCRGEDSPGAELVAEALDDLERRGFDFSGFDSDGDGVIDGVSGFYAGSTSQGWRCGLWPHNGALDWRADGLHVTQFQITGMGSYLRIGTFCHETGHLLFGWPDLYDYDYDSHGVGEFCLMGFGSFGQNPVEPCAYLKDRAGWMETRLLSVSQSCSLQAAVNICYKIPDPTHPDESFLIENRQKFARDARLPGSGLAIWHIDAKHGNQRDQQRTADRHYKVTLMQADGYWDLERKRNRGDTEDLWSYPIHSEWGPSSIPNSNWWDGRVSEAQITSIGPNRETMTFSFLADAFPESLNVNTPENFPDTNFRRIVEAFIGTVPGGLFTAERASEVSWRVGTLRCDRENIRDITGIEYLNGLQSLDCSQNRLTHLDLANNTALVSLRCSGNAIVDLDLSGSASLRDVDCLDNPLKSVNLSGCSDLTLFTYTDGQLERLSLSGCATVAEVDCRNNRLTELDLSGCAALKWLWCSDNRLIELDLSETTELARLECARNQLRELDLSSGTAIRSVDCRENLLTEMTGFMADSSLRALDVRENLLACDDWDDVLALRDRLGEALLGAGGLTAGLAYSPQKGFQSFDCTDMPTPTFTPKPTFTPTPTPTSTPTPTATSTPVVTGVESWWLI